MRGEAVSGRASDKNENLENVAEPLQRIDMTFQLAPSWQSLKDAPVGEFESCDQAPHTSTPLKWTPAGPPVPDPPPPMKIGPFVVEKELGRGGMGVVYKAQHSITNRTEAVKLIGKVAGQAGAEDRFLREIKTIASLDHAAIVRVHAADKTAEGHLYFSMEYVEGENLSDYVKQHGVLESKEACDLACQALRGLQHAHEQDIVHRDIKPGNLIRTRDGAVKIVDFGLALLRAQSSPDLTQGQGGMGTPAFMAPEQHINSHDVDIRADIYSLGASLFYLLTGAPPLPPRSRLGQLCQNLPPGLDNVIERMLEQDRDKRYHTPNEAAAALAPFCTNPLAGGSRQPVRPAAASSQILPAAYESARNDLRDKVRQIPVFGNLYPPIPMEQNFLNVTLDLHATRGNAGYYRLGAPDIRRRAQIKGMRERLPADDPYATAPFGPDQEQEDRSTDLPADKLFDRFAVAVVAGLPGAGKTTILRHLAWRVLRDRPDAIVLYVEAKHLRDSHISARDNLQPDRIFKVLASLFLLPDTDPKKFSAADNKNVNDTALSLKLAWEQSRAVLLLDALDEAPTPKLREWLAQAANCLMAPLNLPPEQPSPAGRCYLSLRYAELTHHAMTQAPVFFVNPLDQAQIKEIARGRLEGKPELFHAFESEITRPDIQKVAGTPLTAMLMVFFFEVYGRFDRRFATYRLLVLFVLYRAWRQIQDDKLPGGHGLDPFFHEVLDSDFLRKRPELSMQYHALAYVARRVLYHSREAEAERAVSRVELEEHLRGWLKQQRQASKAGGIKTWLQLWEREHILLPAGRDHVVFLHSTVLEFLAAVDVGGLLDKRQGPSEVFRDRARDDLESLPILCSKDHETGWRVLEQLGAHASFAPQAVLPLKCLAETERAELDYLALFQDKNLHEQKQLLIDAGSSKPPKQNPKTWAYEYLARWIGALEPHDGATADHQAREQQEIARLEKLLPSLKDAMPLCRDYFVRNYLKVLPDPQSALGKKQWDLLERLVAREHLPSRPAVETAAEPDDSAAPRFEAYLAQVRRFHGDDFARRVSQERNALAGRADLLTLDRPDHPGDTNLAYFRAFLTPALSGFFGSPNFRHGGPVSGLAFSPDGRLAVSASQDGLLILWELPSGREVCRLAGHNSAVLACAFSPDGGRLLSGSYDNTLKLWDATSGRELRSL
ncbi:MAG: protein kinase, partial [Gemmataceae bacterium]|nr:protein kinase [Gemmataceae bacterium]